MRTGPYHGRIADRLFRGAVTVVAGLAPVAVAVAWLPLRERAPNTDVALVLVVVVAGVGFVAGRMAVVLGSLGAGAAFDLLHTRPYGHLAIAGGRDVLTTTLLVAAGLAMGTLAARLAEYRRAAASDADAFALVTDAAGLVATGGEPWLVVEALTDELRTGLGLVDCRFEPVPPDGTFPQIGRSGVIDAPAATVSAAAPAGGDGRPSTLVLPVWSVGAVRAHFLLTLEAGHRPTTAQCRLAVSIADQVGAALHHGPVPPTTPAPRRLRLVRSH